MKPTISIGNQNFVKIRENNYFYIDKTSFIKEWWDNGDDVTLITRPRRFGKTLNISMLEAFFSNQYAARADLFEGLSIWKEKTYQKLQGTYPVISLTFADIKGTTFKDTKEGIIYAIAECYRNYSKLWQKDIFLHNTAVDSEITRALKELSFYLSQYYNKKVIILLDEYDTPLQESYVHGYWEEMVAFTRSLFNSTFKTNPYLERGIMTGITRVSKESIFSDLNNLEVVTVTSNKYKTVFGFTQKEVEDSLKLFDLSNTIEKVKFWYDGFQFGNQTDIYNPWSITKYLDSGKLKTYWVNTSSNSLVSKLIRESSSEIKITMEDLLAKKQVITQLDEEIVFDQLDESDTSIWNLLLASGYLKAKQISNDEEELYQISLTNYEVQKMFKKMIENWFKNPSAHYNDFVKAFLANDIEYMNEYINQVALQTFSSFDTGKHASYTEPERFYHGFVLGLIVNLADKYHITSNRESGFGRYDVVLEPIKDNLDAIIIEFKVYHQSKEKDLQETANRALAQIEEKNYDAYLITKGISKKKIRHYGFAFQGKKVLIQEAIFINRGCI